MPGPGRGPGAATGLGIRESNIFLAYSEGSAAPATPMPLNRRCAGAQRLGLRPAPIGFDHGDEAKIRPRDLNILGLRA